MSEPLVATQDALDQLRRADQRWDAAIRAFDSYPARLRTLAEAAKLRSRALTLAELANITQKPRPGASNLRTLAHELSDAGNRPGPKRLWKRFDQAVNELGQTLETADSITATAAAFNTLSQIADQLADACEPQATRSASSDTR